MKLRLENIGMIKEATVKLNGLTVIAGENDTGKSTVGKALFAVVNYHQAMFDKREDDALNDYYWIFGEPFNPANNCIALTVDSHTIEYEKFIWELPDPIDTVFVEAPLVWNFVTLRKQIALVESQYKIGLDFPFLMRDLIFKLEVKSKTNGLDIFKNIEHIIHGQIRQDEKGDFFFYKNGKKINLQNTATGIKQFGTLQVLSKNGHLDEHTVLILDEPEVHLHPKWQLEMAKVIVELVKNGVKVLVNSHSPYMIEALKRYSDQKEIAQQTDFYLAEKGTIKQIDEDNAKTLVEIYEKLSEPYDTFEAMESQRMEKLIHG